jgi:hypothetical protein
MGPDNMVKMNTLCLVTNSVPASHGAQTGNTTGDIKEKDLEKCHPYYSWKVFLGPQHMAW